MVHSVHSRSVLNIRAPTQPGLAVHAVTTEDQLAPWLPDWERLTARARRYVPGPHDLRAELCAGKRHLLIAVSGPGERPEAMVVFAVGPHLQRFAIGERALLDREIRAVRLIGCTPSPDDVAPAQWQAILHQVMRTDGIDAADLGEVAIGSPIDLAAASLSWPYLRLRPGGKPAYHWTIDLPPTFDAYLLQLRSTTRKSIRYYRRRLEKDPQLRIETVSTSAEVDNFLAVGEEISRQTFQWHVGQRLENDAATRARYHAAAAQGRLRCHLFYSGTKPIAFSRGFINGCVYHYETPGFLVEYGKLSPGLTLLAYVIEDLILNKCCTIFDFGTGGDLTGYKERFGIVSVPSHELVIFNARSGAGVLSWVAGTTLNVVKSIARIVLGNSRIRSWLKRRIRQHGGPAHEA